MTSTTLAADLAYQLKQLRGPRYMALLRIIEENLTHYYLDDLPYRIEDETVIQQHNREELCDNLRKEIESTFQVTKFNLSILIPHILYDILRDHGVVSISNYCQNLSSFTVESVPQLQAKDKIHLGANNKLSFDLSPVCILPTWTKRATQTFAWSSRLQSNLTSNIRPLGAVPTRIMQDHNMCLDHLLALLPWKLKGRYADVAQSCNAAEIRKRILEAMRPEFVQFLTNAHMSKDDLLMVGGDLNYGGAGVYLHILWSNDDPTLLYLYVGQSWNIAQRISSHNNPAHRTKYPSLHYFAMDQGNLNSVYVVLAADIHTDEKDSHYVLNIFEMWSCLIFQTLLPQDLHEWLPDNTKLQNWAYGLNVALPLWQGQGNKALTSFWISNSTDSTAQSESMSYSGPLLKSYQNSLRERFRNLRSSSNPLYRDYYYQVKRKGQATAASIRQKKTFRDLLDGVEKDIRTTPAGRFLVMHQFTIRIPLEKVPKSVNRVNFKADLCRNERHPDVYAVKSTSSDPSRQLGLRVIYHYDGGVKSKWLHTDGTQAVYKMNTLVDTIMGRTIEDLEKTPRRWLGKNRSRERQNIAYT